MNPNLEQLIAAREADVVSLRRYFHRYPELSGQEFNTQRKIIAELTALGLEPRPIAGTGVVVDIIGDRPGKIVAARADIDALPMEDECEQEYRSVNHGACHACGHDGHIAMLLGLAMVMNDMRGSLAGTVRLVFQPSEEQFPGGAEALMQAGALDRVEAIIGAHLWQPLAVGSIGISYGRMMAAPDEFTITLTGRGGHASMPHQAADTLLTGAQLVVALNMITSRNIDPREMAVLSIGMFKAGEVFNVLPKTAVLKGTVRSFDHNVRLRVFERIEQITKGVCEATGIDHHIEKNFGFPPVINNPEVTEVVAQGARETVGVERTITVEPVMVGEDFSIYLQSIPGAFFFVGCGNAERGIVHPHHHPKFDIDEAALCHGILTMAHSVLGLLA